MDICMFEPMLEANKNSINDLTDVKQVKCVFMCVYVCMFMCVKMYVCMYGYMYV